MLIFIDLTELVRIELVSIWGNLYSSFLVAEVPGRNLWKSCPAFRRLLFGRNSVTANSTLLSYLQFLQNFWITVNSFGRFFVK